MKPREFFNILGFRSGPQTYGHEVRTFELPREGTVRYAQWLHPRESDKCITQDSVDEIRKFLSRGDVAIDIGAHTGDSTIPIALAVGKDGCVLALEPNSYVFPVLQKNATLNPETTNIVPLMFAATPADCDLEFKYSDSGFCNGGRFEGISKWAHGHAYTLNVAGKNLPSMLQRSYPQLIPRIRYIKIDAEGYDRVILESLAELISKRRPFIKTEVYKRLTGEQRRELYRSIVKHGYSVYRVADEANYLGEIVEESGLDRWSHCDLFCVPD